MFIITKISLVSTFTMTIGIVLGTLGKLDDKYVNIIVNANIVIQILCCIVFAALFIFLRNWPKGIKILRYKFEDRLIKGDTDIFQKPISSTNPRRMAIFKIYLEVDKFTEPPELGITKIGNYGKPLPDIHKHFLHINSGIKENIFMFHADMIVMPDEKINFKFKKDANIKTFLLGELYLP